MTKIYRAAVRGHLSDIDDATRTALVALADEHDYFNSAFTAEGTFTYDPQLVAFNVRYEMRFVPDDQLQIAKLVLPLEEMEQY